MRINFTFRNFDSSERIKSYASDKIAKFQKYLRAPLDAEVVVSVERHVHMVDVTVTADGQRYSANAESEDMYASIDLCLDKVNRQIRSQKDAQTSRKRHG
ncbi:MAG: ribosome-associated translation inhibitor RaiA [Myxococcota bacterium]